MTIAINWRRIQFHFFNDFKPKKKFWKRRRKTIIEKKNDKSTSFFYSINLCNVEVFDMEHRSGIKTKVYFLFFFFFSFVSFRVSLLFHKKKREEERRRRFFFYFKNKTKKKKMEKQKSINQSVPTSAALWCDLPIKFIYSVRFTCSCFNPQSLISGRLASDWPSDPLDHNWQTERRVVMAEINRNASGGKRRVSPIDRIRMEGGRWKPGDCTQREYWRAQDKSG